MNKNRPHIDDRHRLDEQTEKLLQQLSVPAGRSKEEAWDLLGSKINEAKSSKRHFLPIRWAAAASIAVLISVGVLVATHTTRVVSPRGQHVAVVLPDGSNVLLNSDSQLSYQKFLWWKKREVQLTGEAFFKVKKGRRFDVKSEGCVTSVLGTSFNVFARNSLVKVSCFTGKVGVKNETTGLQAILTPGLGVQSLGQRLGDVQKITETEKGWTSGEFYYTDAPLSEVLAEIGRQFNVSISCKDCENRRYTGYFNNKSLNQSLDLICIPMQLQYNLVSSKQVEIKATN